MVDAVVVGLHLRWEGVWQRPNHVLTRLATRVPVIVVEEPRKAAADFTRVVEVDGLQVVVPERRNSQDAVDAATCAAVRALLGNRQPLFWLFTPLMLDLTGVDPSAPIVYDKMDELSAFKNADSRIRSREDALLERAAVVFAGGHSLWESVRQRARAGGAYPSGVDVEHFATALTLRPRAGQPVTRPVFGYIGVIDERLDLELIAKLARERPDATLLMVGPVAKIAKSALPQAPNIQYLGKRDYRELPSLLARFDVALMPFALNESTRYISPTKTLEYLAAGRPVVSTPVADVVSQFGDVVAVAGSSDEFIAAVRRAEAADRHWIERGIRRASYGAWDAVVDAMLEQLARSGLQLRTCAGLVSASA